MFYNKVYDTFRATPTILRKFLYLIPIEYRLGGKDFICTYNFLKGTEKWNKKKLIAYQRKQLQSLLKHAVKHVPFYSDISLTSSDPFENLHKFPIIDKETIQKNMKAFMADNIPRRNTYHVTTGGTSGNSLSFYLDNSSFGKEWAFKTTGWRRVEFKPGDKVVSFRGIEFRNADKGVYWQDNPIYNMFEMSPFHMSDENLPRYIEKIKKFNPKYLHGYPSAISILAKYVERNVKEFPQIRAVLAISENIYPGQRELIENAFNTRLFSFYGMSERVIMAPECEYDIRYHAYPEYGITEVFNGKDDHVAEAERGELVGTGFLNYCMPFIRYRTGDYAVLSEENCKCGRNHIILENLTGRWWQEMIVGRDEALISNAALNFHSDVFKNVHQYQLVQKRKGKLILKIVPKKGFNDLDEKRIKDAFYKKIGDRLDINIDLVDKISLTKRGKSKFLIQKLNVKRGM